MKLREIHSVLVKWIKAIAHGAVPAHPVMVPLALAVIGFIAFNGYRTYQYIQKDPAYCQLCHVMREPHRQWEASAHRNTICQICHSMDILSQNRLLFSYLSAKDKNDIRHEHGRVTPWQSCTGCHLDTARQGGITLRKSYGHARHVFMERISCQKCHTSGGHNFRPDEKNCLSCHADKGVHGMGMESFACLRCHEYGTVASLPGKQRCLACHPAVGQITAPMGSLECYSCHKPHGKVKPAAEECLRSCHTNQLSIGRHDRHRKVSCLACHRAHVWRVGTETARVLCQQCHAYRPPSSFIF